MKKANDINQRLAAMTRDEMTAVLREMLFDIHAYHDHEFSVILSKWGLESMIEEDDEEDQEEGVMRFRTNLQVIVNVKQTPDHEDRDHVIQEINLLVSVCKAKIRMMIADTIEKRPDLASKVVDVEVIDIA